MGKKIKKRGMYYKRIIIFMLVFMVGVVMPFTGFLFRASEKNVLERINESNDQVLCQMEYNFKYISENMSSLALSIFSQNDVEEIMYSSAPQYDDIYLTMKNLEDTVIQAQTSLQSIFIYNAKTRTWYSTDSDGNETNEIKSFLGETGEVPKLKPMLRKVSVGTDQREVYSYVFSYFMYDYSNPSTGEDSFIVLNQTVDEFVNNLNTGISDLSETYIINQEGEIGGSKKEESVYKEIIQECKMELSKAKGVYEKSYKGEKYLISYINLDDTMNTLVMIQNYQDIFKGMTELRNEFLVLCMVYAIIAIAAIVFMTKRIYTPVNELVNYVKTASDLEEDEGSSGELDEIGHLRKTFQKANILNKKLRAEKNNSQKIVANYWWKNLLNDSSQERINDFYQNLPESVLSVSRQYALAVVYLELDSYEENKFAFAEEDNELLLDSARNVLQEMLEPDFASEAVYGMDEGIVLILNGISKESSLSCIKEHISNMQQFMREHFDVTLSVSYDGISSQLTELSRLYENVRKYESYRLIYGKGSVLGIEKCRENIENTEIVYPRELRKKLDEQLKLGNKEQIYQVLDEIQVSISKLSYDNIVINSMSLATKINTVLSEINRMKNKAGTLKFDKIYNSVLNMEFLDNLFDELKIYIDSVLTESYQHTEQENSREEMFLDMVVEFVRENYADVNLSSQMIADYINMSSRYVMKKFKKCAGITLNEYILTVRMKQAVYLLLNTDMSVGQISKNIGICNENYFYRLFKKVYGCTPREFTAGQSRNEDPDRF